MYSRRVRRSTPRRVVRPVSGSRSTTRRRAFGNMVSAMQQRDATNIVCNASEEVKMYVPNQCKEATVVRNMNAILTTAPMFLNYATMYDQFKLNAVRVSVEMTYINNQLLNSATFPSICTAWDRNGIRPNIVKFGDPAITAYQLPIYDNVASYSSANEKTIYYGSRWGIVRQIDASSMMEKSIYIGTLNTKDVLTTDNLYSCWNPQLLISLKCPRPVTGDSEVVFQFHYQFDLTLRGLRKVALNSLPAGQNETQDKVIDRYFKPNPSFMGYAKNNSGYAVADAMTPGSYHIAPVPAEGNNDAPVNQAAANYPTINPNMSTTDPKVNTGLYVPLSGTASDTMKL